MVAMGRNPSEGLEEEEDMIGRKENSEKRGKKIGIEGKKLVG